MQTPSCLHLLNYVFIPIPICLWRHKLFNTIIVHVSVFGESTPSD